MAPWLLIHFTLDAEFVIFRCATYIMHLLHVPWEQQCFIIVFPSMSPFPSEAPLCEPHEKITFCLLLFSPYVWTLTASVFCPLFSSSVFFFPPRPKKCREIPLDFYACWIANISLSALPPTAHGWMCRCKVRSCFHQYLSCQFTRLPSSSSARRPLQKALSVVVKDAPYIVYKAKWGRLGYSIPAFFFHSS